MHRFVCLCCIIDFCNISSSFFLCSQGICGSNVLLHLRCEPVSHSTFAPQEWHFLGLVSSNNNCRVRFHVKFTSNLNCNHLYFFRYRAKFGTGVQAYLDGQWAESRQILTECQRVLPHDGPTRTLLNTMSKTNFQAPRQWRGYRELTSK